MTNQETAKWFEGESVWNYQGHQPVVIQFDNGMMFVSHNPSKDAPRYIDKLGPMIKVKRWLILPP